MSELALDHDPVSSSVVYATASRGSDSEVSERAPLLLFARCESEVGGGGDCSFVSRSRTHERGTGLPLTRRSSTGVRLVEQSCEVGADGPKG